jgi:hypothetical protein
VSGIRIGREAGAGAVLAGSSANQSVFRGDIDDVELFEGALSFEIANIFLGP